MNQEDVVATVVAAIEQVGMAYMVAGSFASNVHGVPRMTNDADIVVDADEPQILSLVHLLGPDFYVSEDAAKDAVRLRSMFNAIHLKTAFKVDLVVKKDRPFSDEELRRRTPAQLGARTVAFTSPEDTILTKLEWARMGDSERQYDDAVGVMQVQAALDWPYLERWADDIGVRDLLERARNGQPFRQS